MAKKTSSSYFEQRAKLLGFDPNKHFAYFDALPDEPSGSAVKRPLIWPNKKGDLCIGVLDLDGKFMTKDIAPSKSKVDIVPYHVKRLCKPLPDAKYLPAWNGMGVWPWTPPSLIEKYIKKKKIKRLVITEGYLKGLKAYIEGMDVVAIPGITVWKPKKEHEIFYHIKKIVETCQVQEILWLTDGDSLSISYEEGKDLYKRPFSFYLSVKIFKELCREWDVTLYYGHINPNGPKGLDDLLIEYPEEKDQIRKELFHIPGHRRHTVIHDITAWSHHRILKYFGIHASAKEFYDLYSEDIELEEFVYRRGVFRWDEDAQDVVYLKMGESTAYVRVGSQYYRKGSRPTIRGRGEEVLIPIKVDEIKSEHKDKSKALIERIIQDIDYYNGFINRPTHHNYREAIRYDDEEGFSTVWYNEYKKVNWKAKKKDCPVSLSFVKHIFGQDDIPYKGGTIKSYELGLDYIKILWENPMQILPILCLVSKERHTGKTTFWDWMRLIFQQNAKLVRHESLTGQFTSAFSNKVLVIIDEAAIDKRSTIERIKYLSTAKTSDSEAKYSNASEGENFLKIGMSSNNINNFAQIDPDEVRFWVRDVPVVPPEMMNYTLLEDLEKEIPGFLWYIENRAMATENGSRAWFDKDLIITDALRRVQRRSRSGKEIVLEKAIKEHMLNVGKPVIKLSSKNIKRLLDDSRMVLSDIRWVVDQQWEIPSSNGSQYYELYHIESDPTDFDEPIRVVSTKKKSVHYIFTADRYYKPGELCKFFKVAELLQLEEELTKLNKPTFFQKVKSPDVLNIVDYSYLLEQNTSTIKEMANEYSTFREFNQAVQKLSWIKE